MIPITMQMSLFDNRVEKLQLYRAVDDIKDRFGSKILTKAVNSGSKEDGFNFTQHNKKKTPEDKSKKD
jgi:DNA polymerase-4